MNKTNFPGVQRFQFVNTSTMEEELILAKDLVDAKINYVKSYLK